MLWWAPEARLKRLITIDPDGEIPVAAMTEKPTILLCPHFVCLDVAGASIAMEASASSMYVTQKNAAFEEIPVDGDPAGQQAMADRANGRSTVPQIFIGATHVGGCDDLYALERAGKLDPLLTA